MLELLELVIRYALKVFGPAVLQWSVDQLLSKLRETEVPAGPEPEETYFWDKETECDAHDF